MKNGYEKTTVSLLIGFDILQRDNPLLIVGRKNKGQKIDIINAFSGEEAKELYQKLITKKGEV